MAYDILDSVQKRTLSGLFGRICPVLRFGNSVPFSDIRVCLSLPTFSPSGLVAVCKITRILGECAIQTTSVPRANYGNVLLHDLVLAADERVADDHALLLRLDHLAQRWRLDLAVRVASVEELVHAVEP